jgi:formamidase
MVGKARRNLGTMDLVVFPRVRAARAVDEHGDPALMCTLDGPEVAAFRAACVQQPHLGLLLHHGGQPARQPVQHRPHHRRPGRAALYYRKLHPWVPVEPWEPGDIGVPGVRRARTAAASRSSSATTACSRRWRASAAYKGAEIIIRTAGYTAPIRHAWKITNQANAFQNLARHRQRVHVRQRRQLRLHGRRHVLQLRRHGRWCKAATGPTRSSPPSCGPDLVREARALWGVENNIYQLWPPRLRGREGRRAATAPTPSCRTWWRAATACPGTPTVARADGTLLRLCRAERATASTEPNLLERRLSDPPARLPSASPLPPASPAREDRCQHPLPPGPSTATCARDNTALVIIDMQTDFCGIGGYVDKMGYDLVAHARADRAASRGCSARHARG